MRMARLVRAWLDAVEHAQPRSSPAAAAAAACRARARRVRGGATASTAGKPRSPVPDPGALLSKPLTSPAAPASSHAGSMGAAACLPCLPLLPLRVPLLFFLTDAIEYTREQQHHAPRKEEQRRAKRPRRAERPRAAPPRQRRRSGSSGDSLRASPRAVPIVVRAAERRVHAPLAAHAVAAVRRAGGARA